MSAVQARIAAPAKRWWQRYLVAFLLLGIIFAADVLTKHLLADHGNTLYHVVHQERWVAPLIVLFFLFFGAGYMALANPALRLPWAIALGGSLGNILNIIGDGAVPDWIPFHVFSIYIKANIADIALIGGTILFWATWYNTVHQVKLVRFVVRCLALTLFCVPLMVIGSSVFNGQHSRSAFEQLSYEQAKVCHSWRQMPDSMDGIRIGRQGKKWCLQVPNVAFDTANGQGTQTVLILRKRPTHLTDAAGHGQHRTWYFAR